MKKDETKVIRLTEDAYNALGRLRKKIVEHGQRSYSYSDIVLTATLLLDNAVERNIANVMDIVTVAKGLRLQKLRGELPKSTDVFEELKKHFPNSVDQFTTPVSKIISSIIKQLIENGYPDAASYVLFLHKDKLSPEEFVRLSVKTLEAQVQMKIREKEQSRE
ncbi:hypothetical protein [Thermococcus barophilus]|uniref:Uncharacterized protein n=1 Tax=Thermococcus barophilus TaxID=55802 RepID=A0A0S1XCK9_THEBA|nr:hypothetical protein [Thermococcus barophilus]ALM75526.1 hypothetical protein TBCH5v1_1613 [Thermococcus barophilus]